MKILEGAKARIAQKSRVIAFPLRSLQKRKIG